MIALFTDLDNTMIYSAKRNIKVDKTCVEYLDGRGISYMTNTSIQTLSKLKSIEDILIIPITTRTFEQYNRISIGDFKYSLLCNGGLLLKDGIVDEEWLSDSVSIASRYINELNTSIELLKNDPDVCFEVRFVSNLFVFTKSNNPEETMSRLKHINNVSVFNQGSKVYVFPNGLSKGNAINRFKKYLDEYYIVSAGDSPLDFSMSDSSDMFLTSNKNYKGVSEDKFKIFENNIFSDDILSYVESLV